MPRQTLLTLSAYHGRRSCSSHHEVDSMQQRLQVSLERTFEMASSNVHMLFLRALHLTGPQDELEEV